MAGVLNALCTAQWTDYLLDGVVALFFLITVVVSGRKGFIHCFFKIISTLVAIFVAIALAKVTLKSTGGLFGLQDKLVKSFQSLFGKIDAFTADVSNGDVESALESGGISAVVGKLVLKMLGNKKDLPEGTTLATLLGETVGRLAATLLVGVALFVIVKLVMRILRKALTSWADKFSLLSGVNTLLGSIFGFLYAGFIVCAILAALSLFPVNAITKYLENTLFIGELYDHNPLISILAKIL